MIMYLIMLVLAISTSFFAALYWTIKVELKHLQDNFQMKLLAKHINLTREIEALSKLRSSELDFTALDGIIENLRRLHNGQ
jgi:hypothetical protein